MVAENLAPALSKPWPIKATLADEKRKHKMEGWSLHESSLGVAAIHVNAEGRDLAEARSHERTVRNRERQTQLGCGVPASLALLVAKAGAGSSRIFHRTIPTVFLKQQIQAVVCFHSIASRPVGDHC
jgi:hypothetical protein